MIVTIWGSSGSGKTTLTANLALALAEQKHIVGVIDSRLDYAELTMLYGQRILSKHGTYMALRDNDTIAHYWESEKNPNLFIMSVPNEYSGFEEETVSLEQSKQLLSQSREHFDFVLIDGHESKQNPISSTSLTMAKHVFMLHKPTMKSLSWLASTVAAIPLLHLEDKLLHVLNQTGPSYETSAYLSKSKIQPDYTLPFVPNAPLLGEMGTPLYQTAERGAKEYRSILAEMIEKLEN